MYNVFSSPTVTNCTFSGNSAFFNGGGMYNEFSSPTVTNCILWGDSPDEIFNNSSTPTIAYSDVQGSGGSGAWDVLFGTDGGGNIDTDPFFVDEVGGDLRLTVVSPCVEVGDNAAVPVGVTTDLDGNPRFFDADVDTIATVDMGAYELQQLVAPDPLEPCQNHWAPDPGGAKRNRTGCIKMPASAGGQDVAIRVTLRRLYIDLNKDPVNGCPVRQGLPDLSLFEGEVRYLGPPSAFDDNSVINPRFIAAKLQCTQFFRDWSPAALAADFPGADTSQIYYNGTEVFPCSIHDVQQATENCKETANPEDCFSAPLEVRTSLWGDVWEPFENVSFTDIGKVVDAFKSLPFIKGPPPPPTSTPRKVRAMLRGNSVPLSTSVNFTDIGRCVDAFKTVAYTELGPSAEICDDGIDNNCNGAIDEDGAPCTVPLGNGVCMAGVCVVP